MSTVVTKDAPAGSETVRNEAGPSTTQPSQLSASSVPSAAVPQKHNHNYQQQQQQQQQQHPKKSKKEWVDYNKNKRRKNKPKFSSYSQDYNNDNEGGKRDNDNSNSRDTIHPGSYAHPDQRALFVPGDDISLEVVATESSSTSTSKKKIAVLLGYVGTNYAGFQINMAQRTIQSEVEYAAYRAGFIAPSNFGFPQKYAWSTSGRTDKGVHAAAQVVSFKVEWPNHAASAEEDVNPTTTTTSTIRDALNAHLPHDICVLDVVRTTRSFCAKTNRDRVRYQYMIPSFCFYPAKEIRNLMEDLGVNPLSSSTTAATAGDPVNAKHKDGKINEPERSNHQLSPEALSQLRSSLTPYRATPDNLQTLQQCLARYQGTHSFHNFARKVSSQEARAMRYIESFVVESPIVIDGVEWIPTLVTGQSFMLNQIRKMISLAVDVTRGAASVEFLQHALTTREPLNISNAPAQGLFLDMSIYHNYNQYKVQPPQQQQQQQKPSKAAPAAQSLDALDWHIPGTASHARWREFRDTTILPHVTRQEATEGNFVSHLFSQEYVFDYRRQYHHNPSLTPNNHGGTSTTMDEGVEPQSSTITSTSAS